MWLPDEKPRQNINTKSYEILMRNAWGGRAMGRSYNYTYQKEGKKICCDFKWQKLSGLAKRFQFKSLCGVKNDTTHRSVKDAFTVRAGWKMC